MSPWNKKDNPFDPPGPQEPKKRHHPATIVTVACHNPECVRLNKNRSVNISVSTDDNGLKRKHCRDCHSQWEVQVSPGGVVKVWQMNQFGANRHEIPFELVWQDKL